jgi:hypothetical protein
MAALPSLWAVRRARQRAARTREASLRADDGNPPGAAWPPGLGPAAPTATAAAAVVAATATGETNGPHYNQEWEDMPETTLISSDGINHNEENNQRLREEAAAAEKKEEKHTALKSERLAGPKSFWDPPGLTADGSTASSSCHRQTAIKHGSITMLAAAGQSTHQIIGKLFLDSLWVAFVAGISPGRPPRHLPDGSPKAPPADDHPRCTAAVEHWRRRQRWLRAVAEANGSKHTNRNDRDNNNDRDDNDRAADEAEDDARQAPKDRWDPLGGFRTHGSAAYASRPRSVANIARCRRAKRHRQKALRHGRIAMLAATGKYGSRVPDKSGSWVDWAVYTSCLLRTEGEFHQDSLDDQGTEGF